MIIQEINPGILSTADPVIITFTTSGSTATGAAIAAKTIIEVVATENCYVAFGTSAPTAASTTHFLVANTYRRFKLDRALYVAARGVINGGFLYIATVITGS